MAIMETYFNGPHNIASVSTKLLGNIPIIYIIGIRGNIYILWDLVFSKSESITPEKWSIGPRLP